MSYAKHLKEHLQLGVLTTYAYTHVSLSSGSQTIPHNIGTAVAFAKAIHDPLATWVIGQPTRITAPSGARFMRVHGRAEWVINGTGYRSLRININGVATAEPQYSPTDVRTANGTISDHNNCTSGIIPVTPGDYIELMARQNSGGNLALNASNTRLVIEWIR